jgi:hypothetical protein
MTFTVQLSSPLPYDHCYFNIYSIGRIKSVDSGEVTYNDQVIEENAYASGSFSGNTFVGSWDREDGGFRREGDMTVLLNAARDSVVSFYAHETTASDGSLWKEYTLQASNVPLDLEAGGEIGFFVGGAATCDHIDDMEYELDLSSDDRSRTLEELTCTSLSEVTIYFDREE